MTNWKTWNILFIKDVKWKDWDWSINIAYWNSYLSPYSYNEVIFDSLQFMSNKIFSKETLLELLVSFAFDCFIILSTFEDSVKSNILLFLNARKNNLETKGAKRSFVLNLQQKCVMHIKIFWKWNAAASPKVCAHHDDRFAN